MNYFYFKNIIFYFVTMYVEKCILKLEITFKQPLYMTIICLEKIKKKKKIKKSN